jgi:hypothetical protein
MDLENLHTTSTNAGQESHGSVIGIDLHLFRWVILVMAAGLAAFAWLQAKRGVGLIFAFWLIVVPAGLVALFLVLFTQNRHPSFPRDVAETLLTGGDAAPGLVGSTKGGGFRTDLPDGFFMNDLLVFNGLGPGGYVAKGFWLDVPDLHHASAQERNRFDDQIRRLLKLQPQHYDIQIHWWVDSDYQDALLRFQAQTAKFKEPACQTARNFPFLHFWEQMQKGRLRRQRVAIVVGRPIAGPGRVPRRVKAAARHYDELLAQCHSEFAEFGHQLHALFSGISGGAIPMTNEDHFKVILHTLNPSIAQRFGFDPVQGFNINRSILDNCWHGALRGRGGTRGFWLDEYEHGVLVLKNWPVQVYPTIIHRLTNLPFSEYTITTRFRRLPVERLLARAQRELDRINQQLAAKPNELLMVTKGKLEERIRRLSRGDRVPLQVEIIIVVRARTAEILSDRMLAVKSAIHSLQGAMYAEGVPAFSRNSFLKSILGNMRSRHRGPELYGEDDVVAPMLPLGSTLVADLDFAEAIYPGPNGSVVGIRLSSGEGRHAMPTNYLVIGSPGQGKSVLVSDLILQTAGHFTYIFIVEEGLSHAEVTKGLGGEPILFRPDGRQSFNMFDSHGLPMMPFQHASITAMVCLMVGLSADEDKAHHRRALIAKHVQQVIEEFADDCLRAMTEDKRRQLVRRAMAVQQYATAHDLSLAEAFVELRDRGQGPDQGDNGNAAALWEFQATHAQVVRDFVFTTLKSEQHLTLSALKEHLEVNATGPESEACAQIATLLVPFCGESSTYGAIFDRTTNVTLTGRVVHFERGFISAAETHLKSLTGFLILNQIRQHLITLPRDQRKMLVLEELARLLDVPGAESLVNEIYSQMRKANVVVISILQQISQVTNSALRAAILGNSPNLIIFNHDRTALAELAQQIGLSSVAQEAILRYARPSQRTGQTFSEFCLFMRGPLVTCGTVRHVQFAPPAEAGPSDKSVNKPNP